MTKRNSSLGEIVGRQFQGDFIAGEHADAIAAQPAGQVGQNYTVVFELDAEQAAGKLLQDCAGYFDAVFFAHIPLEGGPGLDRPARRTLQAAVTLVACRPLGPLVTSNSTLEPSSRVR